MDPGVGRHGEVVPEPSYPGECLGPDQLLIKNGEKIVNLNESVAAVRLDQQRLDHELDFVVAQQAELEEALKPLEASLAYCGPVDIERERTYAVNSFNCGNNKVVHDILSVS